MRNRNPVAFMSYVHADDAYGRLTELREHLSQEARIQIGREFEIFQDRNAILWGQNWKQRIEESIDEVTFLIPIITPGFFNSPYCRDELQRFLDREKELNRNDLILPIYYVTTSLLDDEAERANDELAQVIATRQYADWRDLRFEPFTSPQVGKSLAGLVAQLRHALESVQGARTADAEQTSQGSSRSARETSTSKQTTEGTRGAGSVAGEPAAKTEPPTHIVDPWLRGDYSTIAEAVVDASPGDRILVRPGFYQHGLVINKPLEIIGDGPLDEIVVEARGEHTILFQTTIGRVSNLTLRQVGDGGWNGVDITQGRLDLEGCDISSQSLACVAIRGGADPRLRRNRIHNSNQGGVLVSEGGKGSLEDNDIFANTLSGVEIRDEGSDSTLRRNRIHDGNQGGLLIDLNGRGTLEDNDIFANTLSGVEIRRGGDPTLRNNRIHDGKVNGVLVNEGGKGTLENNDIFANSSIVGGGGFPGVGIAGEGANPTLRNNRIHDGKGGGVLVNNGGKGTLEDNDISANTLSGVEINGEDSDPTLRRNRIHDGKEAGVLVNEGGKGTLEDNDIFANTLVGVEIRGEGSHPTLRNNRINKNGNVGVWVYDGGGATIENNDLRDNGGKGAFYVEEGSESKVQRVSNQG
jgi:parallel beta-helix repeat protein